MRTTEPEIHPEIAIQTSLGQPTLRQRAHIDMTSVQSFLFDNEQSLEMRQSQHVLCKKEIIRLWHD